MISQKEINDLTRKLKAIPDTIPVTVFSAIIENLHLNINTIDPSYIELIDRPTADIAAEKSLEKLNAWRMAIAKMRMYIATEINKRNVYNVLDIGADYRKTLALKKISKKNDLRNVKESDKENHLIASDKDIETKKRLEEISKIYHDVLKTYLDPLESYENSLNRIIDQRAAEEDWQRRKRN